MFLAASNTYTHFMSLGSNQYTHQTAIEPWLMPQTGLPRRIALNDPTPTAGTFEAVMAHFAVSIEICPSPGIALCGSSFGGYRYTGLRLRTAPQRKLPCVFPCSRKGQQSLMPGLSSVLHVTATGNLQAEVLCGAPVLRILVQGASLRILG